MEKQSRKSFSFLENINPERKKFIKPFIFGYHGNISLLKRFEERYGQKFFILSTASLCLLDQGKKEEAKTSINKAKEELLFFCNFILSIYGMNEKEFINQYLSDILEVSEEDKAKKDASKKQGLEILQQIKNDSSFMEYVKKFRKLVNELGCTKESLDKFFENIKKLVNN